MVETEQMADKLNAVNAKQDVGKWVAAEIEGHLAVATNRPISLTVTNVPTWMKAVVDDSSRSYIIEYEASPRNDHVSFWCWSGMAGGWGVLLGAPRFEPDTNRFSKSEFYVVKSSPGLYTWHTRSDH